MCLKPRPLINPEITDNYIIDFNIKFSPKAIEGLDIYIVLWDALQDQYILTRATISRSCYHNEHECPSINVTEYTKRNSFSILQLAVCYTVSNKDSCDHGYSEIFIRESFPQWHGSLFDIGTDVKIKANLNGHIPLETIQTIKELESRLY